MAINVMASNIAKIPMTTKSSMSVKPFLYFIGRSPPSKDMKLYIRIQHRQYRLSLSRPDKKPKHSKRIQERYPAKDYPPPREFRRFMCDLFTGWRLRFIVFYPKRVCM